MRAAASVPSTARSRPDKIHVPSLYASAYPISPLRVCTFRPVLCYAQARRRFPHGSDQDRPLRRRDPPGQGLTSASWPTDSRSATKPFQSGRPQGPARRLPDAALCQALDITVNDLLTGVRVSASDYQKKAEENMMDLIKENQENKKRFALSMVCAAITVIAVVALVFLRRTSTCRSRRASPCWRWPWRRRSQASARPSWKRRPAIMSAPPAMSFSSPTLGEYVRGYHTLTKRRLTCPHCGKTGMCRHRIVR